MESAIGQGTTFRIYLPRAKEIEAQNPAAALRPMQGGWERSSFWWRTTPPSASSPQQCSRSSVTRWSRPRTGKRRWQSLESSRARNGPSDHRHGDAADGRSGSCATFGPSSPHTRILFTSGYPTHVMDPVTNGPCMGFIQKPFVPKTLAAQVRTLLDMEVQPQLHDQKTNPRSRRRTAGDSLAQDHSWIGKEAMMFGKKTTRGALWLSLVTSARTSSFQTSICPMWTEGRWPPACRRNSRRRCRLSSSPR